MNVVWLGEIVVVWLVRGGVLALVLLMGKWDRLDGCTLFHHNHPHAPTHTHTSAQTHTLYYRVPFVHLSACHLPSVLDLEDRVVMRIPLHKVNRI